MPTAGSPDRIAYVEVAECDSYHAARGNAAWTGDTEAKQAAIVRATAFIDANYRSRFPGQKTNGRDQSLEWPRENYDSSFVTDDEGFDIANDEIPIEICDATCEAALRELTSPGSLMPDMERGGNIQRMAAGSVEIEYSSNAASKTTFTIIDGILSGLLGNVSRGGLVMARAVRG